MTLAEFFQAFVPAVAVPLGLFAGNWAFRGKKGYSQTAAADFLLAVVIFDATVISASEAFKPFVRDPDFRAFVLNWHLLLAVVSGLLWLAILSWCEPKLEVYYRCDAKINLSFPILSFLAAWMLVFFDLAAHIGFFVMQGSA